MKLLFVISHLTNDGPVHALKSIVEGFQGLGGHEIVILTLSDHNKDELSHEFVRAGVRVVNIQVNQLFPVVALLRIRRFLSFEKFDVASSTCIRADAMLGLASLTLPSQRIFTTVQNIPREDLGFLFPGIWGKLAAWLHYRVLRLFGGRIICVSNVIRFHLREEIGVNGFCVLNPVKVEFGVRKFGVSERVITFAASLSERKNPKEAIDFVLHSLPAGSYKYKVFGRGQLEEALRERYKENKDVEFLGFSKDLSKVFDQSSVYVSSSKSEGFPLTPQIALICGCPCVLSDIPQHRELAGLSRFVYLYRPGDERDFAIALSAALKADRELSIFEGQKLGEHVSPKSIANQLNELFKRT